MINLLKLKELNIKYPELKDLNASTCHERYFKIHFSDLHKYIIEHTIDTNWNERLYMFYNDLIDKPKCPVCGNYCKFGGIKIGYSLHCSRKCVSKSEITKRKKEETSIKKWGTKNPAQSKIVKDKIKSTNIEKYGVENVYQSKIVKDKIKSTNIEKYGVEYGLQRKDVREKIKQTCLNKYGVEYISQSQEFKDICKHNSIKKYGVEHPMKDETVKQNVRKIHKEKYGVEYISQRPEVSNKISKSLRNNHMQNDDNVIGYTIDGQQIIKCPHVNCDKCSEKYFITPSGIYYDRKRINAEVCTKILPIQSLISTYELNIRQLLEINNIEYQSNVRNIISNELDIYIPSKNIAIEFNGIYWHCDKNKDKNYHINKFKECQEKGIQLITIWEDQYINKKDIIESLLLHKLGITSNKVFARKCIIDMVQSDVAQKFYSENHLQGKCSASVHYALKLNDEIVAMMSFGKRAISNNKSWELIRYCSKTHINVVGGASKLFKHFISEHNPCEVISWSSNDISNGNMYKQLGFECVGITAAYWYIKNLKRYHRSNFNKSNLIKKGIIFDDDKRSESQIMSNLGYLKIWDTGQSKWTWSM